MQNGEPDGLGIHAHHKILMDNQLFPSEEGLMLSVVEAPEHELQYPVSPSVFIDFLRSPKVEGHSELAQVVFLEAVREILDRLDLG